MSGAVLWQRAEGARVFPGALAILTQDWQPIAWWLTPGLTGCWARG